MLLEAEEVLKILKEGNERFTMGRSVKCSVSSLQKIKDYAENGQVPKAIVLCCSDSRAPAEIVFDQDVGDLFVIRVAGNVVAPSLVGSVEFAASTFGTKLVLVMGHTQCGAIKATIQLIENPESIDSENIHDIVGRIKPFIAPVINSDKYSYEEKMDKATKANIMASVNQLSHSSSLIESLLKEKKIMIVGAILDLSSGKVEFLNT